MMMKPLIKRTIYIPGALFLLIFGTFIVVNILDEELNPKIPALLQRLAQPVPQAGNAYYYMLGLWAGGDDNDVLDNGIAVHAAYYRQLEQNPRALPEERDYYQGLEYTNIKMDRLGLCVDYQAVTCLEAARDHGTTYRKAFKRNHLLLTRYQKLMTYSNYQEPIPAADNRFNDFITLHKLYITWLAREWIEGRQKPALAQLARSHAFWRTVITAETSLITRITAITVLEHNFQLLSEMLDSCGNCLAHSDELKSLLTPFSNQALNQRGIMLREFASLVKRIPEADELDKAALFDPGFADMLMAQLYRPNAIRNNMYALFNRYAKTFGLPPSDFLTERAALQAYIEEINHPTLREMFFNFVESLIRAVAMPNLGFYERNFQLEDRRRLLAIKFLLRSRSIEGKTIASFVTRLDLQAYGEIATGKPPVYDEKTGTLSFDMAPFEYVSEIAVRI